VGLFGIWLAYGWLDAVTVTIEYRIQNTELDLVSLGVPYILCSNDSIDLLVHT
jgi:hypothetical protein